MDKPLSLNAKNKYKARVLKVLTEQNFIIGEREKDLIEGKTNGRRYFFMVAKRKEGEILIDRFIKIPQNNTKKLLEPFTRQIRVAKYLKENTDLHTRDVIESNYDAKKGIPFAIMETFPESHSKIGFIEGNDKVELLGQNEARNVINNLQKFHSIDFDKIPKDLKKIIKPKSRGSGFDYIKKSVGQYLSAKVLPLDAKDNKKELLHKVLERRLAVPDFKKKILEVLNVLEPIVEDDSNKGVYLVHGDMAPNNLYVFNTGEVELLDLEWVSVFKNKIVAMVYDFGNMRVRAWKNKLFRDSLDQELLTLYKSKGEENIGKAIVCLSILRSNIHFSKYFENYDWDKQKREDESERRKVAEEEIKKVWEFDFSD